MRLHRFYVGDQYKLTHYVEVQDAHLVHQWQRVLRYGPGQQVILFDGTEHERLYTITTMSKNAVHVELVTELERRVPERELYLFWSLLKKDKNDWVLQKCTELGVSHFVPILAERSEKTGFNVERAQKIVIEAAEQCGRSDIPSVQEPLHLQTALHDYAPKVPLFVCEQNELTKPQKPNYKEVGVLVGPEGGWSDPEKQLFTTQEIGKLQLSAFTLRAETACIIAVHDLL